MTQKIGVMAKAHGD